MRGIVIGLDLNILKIKENIERLFVLFNFKHNISKLGKLFRQQATVKSIKTFKNWSFFN